MLVNNDYTDVKLLIALMKQSPVPFEVQGSVFLITFDFFSKVVEQFGFTALSV